ncbi:MAG: twin-arginine translocase TatA/TatE family subunit [Eubacteriales bacterium]|nr:twin-arginine translocase TatA/TatE family subunit [Eubacteriales bacterium]
MRLGITEIILILVLALVLFGGKKLAGVGKALGQSIREFKNEVVPGDKKKETQQDAEIDADKDKDYEV